MMRVVGLDEGVVGHTKGLVGPGVPRGPASQSLVLQKGNALVSVWKSCNDGPVPVDVWKVVLRLLPLTLYFRRAARRRIGWGAAGLGGRTCRRCAAGRECGVGADCAVCFVAVAVAVAVAVVWIS